MVDSIYMSAMLVGSFVYGYLADKLGRRPASIMALFNVASGLLVTAFMEEYVSFTVLRFITGIGNYCLEMIEIF